MRIIAGQHKGRRLLGPKGTVTRPITDRVKTALFSILGPAVEAAAVVDLFSGTGSLGLEALSRGAASCRFAERDRSALDRLRRNIDAMALADRCTIWRGDVLRLLGRWLAGMDADVDLAFVDPPYLLARQRSAEELTARLFAPLAGRLSPDGTVVFRCESNIALPDAFGPLRVRDRRTYGKMALVFLEHELHE